MEDDSLEKTVMKNEYIIKIQMIHEERLRKIKVKRKENEKTKVSNTRGKISIAMKNPWFMRILVRCL